MAFGALHALRRSGLRCPEDMSLVGIDGHELTDTFDVTTVSQPVTEQGAAAARWLVARLDGSADPQAPDDDVSLHPVRLELRGSTGPPPPV
jgi:DNA-binding LacI/PurR family transcriptional regulator